MAGRIIWSLRAEAQLLEILDYWKNRNKSIAYSRKLKRMFLETVRVLARQPYLGRMTNMPDVYQKLIRDYCCYQVRGNDLLVLSILILVKILQF